MSSKSSKEESDPDGTPCRQCRSVIPLDAKLCRYCNSYQDWRGYLHISSTLLALLVALVSVLSITLPAIIGALQPRNSRVVLSSPTIRGETIYLIASNVGSKPGVIQRGHLETRYPDVSARLEPINPADAFIAPGTKHIGLRIGLRLSALDTRMRNLDVLIKAPTDNARAEAGYIGFWKQDAYGKGSYVRLPISHEDIMTLLEAHASRCEGATAPPTIHDGCSGLRELQNENDRLHKKLQKALRKAQNPSTAHN